MADEHVPNLLTLGSFIRERRRALGVTQMILGVRLGWKQERISLLERGRYGLPSVPALAHLAAGLESSLGDLLQALGYDLAFQTGRVEEDHARPQ